MRTKKEVYQCTECLTVYDQELGDKKAAIQKDTLFENLPDNYKCPVCESEKNLYQQVFI